MKKLSKAITQRQTATILLDHQNMAGLDGEEALDKGALVFADKTIGIHVLDVCERAMTEQHVQEGMHWKSDIAIFPA